MIPEPKQIKKLEDFNKTYESHLADSTVARLLNEEHAPAASDRHKNRPYPRGKENSIFLPQYFSKD